MITCSTVLARRVIMMRCFFSYNPDNDSDEDHTLSRCVSRLEQMTTMRARRVMITSMTVMMTRSVDGLDKARTIIYTSCSHKDHIFWLHAYHIHPLQIWNSSSTVFLRLVSSTRLALWCAMNDRASLERVFCHSNSYLITRIFSLWKHTC